MLQPDELDRHQFHSTLDTWFQKEPQSAYFLPTAGCTMNSTHYRKRNAQK